MLILRRYICLLQRHKDGIASVIFKLAEEADVCSTAMNNRMWGTRLITAEAWDGNTKYEVEETEAEREKRIQEWGNFLDGKEETKVKKDGEDKTDGTKNDPAKPEDDAMTAGKEGCGKGGEEEVCGKSGEEELCGKGGEEDVCGKSGEEEVCGKSGEEEVVDKFEDICRDGESDKMEEEEPCGEDEKQDAGSDEQQDAGFDEKRDAVNEEVMVQEDGGDIGSESDVTSPSEQAGQTEDATCTESMETDVQQEPVDGSTV